MNKRALIEKYTKLSRDADIREKALRGEMICARRAKDSNSAEWKELADYEDSKYEHSAQRHVAQIYGQICADLGDE